MKTIFKILPIIFILGLMSCQGAVTPPTVTPPVTNPVVTSIPAGSIRVHYKRDDNTYTGWGIHLWNVASATPAITAAVGTSWATPRLPTASDTFGAYWDIPVIDITLGLNFIIHKADAKDVGSDLTFPTTGEKEFWILSGNSTIYLSEPNNAPKSIKMTSTTVIQAIFNKDLLATDTVTLTDSLGTAVTATKVVAGAVVTFTSDTPYEETKSYVVSFNGTNLGVNYDTALIKSDYTYTGDDLGVTLSSGSATFKLWTPVASEVTLQIFDKTDQEIKVGTAIPLIRGQDGIWAVTVAPTDLIGVTDLDGYFYQYTVTALGETKIALDPYARSMASFKGSKAGSTDYVGKAAIVSLSSTSAGTKPTRQTNAVLLSSDTDLIAYEVHIRDFTMSNPAVTEADKGTFKGFAQGLDHLVNLGVTHVQLLPVTNHFRVDETNRSFQGEIANPNFNWGYDPHNYFTLEGQYSTNSIDPYTRIKEFRDLVTALHAKNIGVIMDVVFNHTYSNSVFDNVAPGLYYRAAGGATPVGAPAVETRNPMVRKLIIDNLKMWVNEFGVDGFRFDLMGFIDVQTMADIRTALGSDIILHGEAWDFTDLPASDKTVKGNKAFYPYSSKISLFNDTIRDSVKGSSENGGESNLGFVQGAGDLKALIAGIVAGVDTYNPSGLPVGLIDSTDTYRWFAKQPGDALQVLEVHDGFTLWDKINFTVAGNATLRAKYYNQASAMLFTSQGKILIEGGMEFGRTKPLAANDPEPLRASTVKNITPTTADPDLLTVTKFHNNTYSSSDYTNQMRWGRLTDSVFSPINSYYQGLIKMRRGIPALRYSTAANVVSGVKFLVQSSAATPGQTKASYTNFTTMPSLTLKFTNGPANAKYYLVGEVYATNANPAVNSLSVTFDAQGTGTIVLSRAVLDAMDPGLDSWGGAGDLNFKLVLTQGAWDSVPGAYSGLGNNTLKASNVLIDDSISIDLKVIDQTPGEVSFNGKLLAYELDNTLENVGSGTTFTKLIVIHNASTATTVASTLITDTADWKLILDDDEAGIVPVTTPPVGFSISTGIVSVPANTSLVLAK